MRDDHTDLRKVIPALESGSYPAGAGHIRGIQVFGTDSEMMGNDVTGTYQKHTGFRYGNDGICRMPYLSAFQVKYDMVFQRVLHQCFVRPGAGLWSYMVRVGAWQNFDGVAAASVGNFNDAVMQNSRFKSSASDRME